MNKKRSSVFDKKIIIGVFIGLLAVFILIGNISAAESGSSAGAGFGTIIKTLAGAIDSIVKEADPLLKTVFGEGEAGATLTGEQLFAKFFFFIIIFCVIWISMDQLEFFKDKGGYLFFIVLAASLLAVRFIAQPQILAIILPYTALGITISAALPFVIYWIIVEVGLKNHPSGVRKVAWIFFAVVMIGLYITRYQDLATTNLTKQGDINWADMYLVTAFLSFIMLIIDGSINKWYRKMSMERELSSQDYILYTKLLRRRKEINEGLIQARKENNKTMVNRLTEEISAIEGQMLKLRTKH